MVGKLRIDEIVLEKWWQILGWKQSVFFMGKQEKCIIAFDLQ